MAGGKALARRCVMDIMHNALTHSITNEISKGCSPKIFPNPVPLEPPFKSYRLTDFMRNDGVVTDEEPETILDTKERKETVFLRIWYPMDHKLNWKESESLLREFTVLTDRCAFEIIGNKTKIITQFALDLADAVPVKNAIQARFPKLRIECHRENHLESYEKGLIDNNIRDDYGFDLHDYCPLPPYFRNMTLFQGTDSSPLASIYAAFSEVKEDELACFQVLFTPTDESHNWGQNILHLIEAEQQAIRYGSSISKALSATISSQYREARKKVLEGRPLFAVAIRIGVFSRAQRNQILLRTLGLPMRQFRYGGSPLQVVTGADYIHVLGEDMNLTDLFTKRLTHRHGILLNSAELTGVCHFPDPGILENEGYELDRLIGFDAAAEVDADGLLLGHNEFASIKTPVRQPTDMRKRHTVTYGKTGKGKSILLGNMIVQGVGAGQGIGVIDPHGDLVDAVLPRIPKERVDDVILFDPCDEEYTLCFNPLEMAPGQSVGKIADDYVASMRSLFSSWGERMENTFRHSFYALLSMPGMTFADLRTLLSKEGTGEGLRAKLLPHLKNEEAVRFWTEDFPAYSTASMDPVLNKLSKLLLNDSAARIFSQRKSLFDFRKIMDQGQVFLARLPAGILGGDTANVIGSMLVSAFYHAAMSRADSTDRRPFYLHIDEAHRFRTSSVEDILMETRKYGLALTLAYQQRSQMDDEARTVLDNAGTVIAFELGLDDAQRMAKQFGGEVEAKDFLKLGKGRAYVRMDDRIVDIATSLPEDKSDGGSTEAIIAHSKSMYYEPAGTIRSHPSPQPKSKRKKKALYDEL